MADGKASHSDVKNASETTRVAMMANKQKITLTISVVISAIFLVMAFQGLNPSAVIETFRNAQIGWLIAGFCIYLLSVLAITRRWKFLLDDSARVPMHDLYPLVAIGYMGNNIYPFRAGEVMRLGLLRQAWGVPLGRGAVTVMVERCFDGLVMLTFILVPALFVNLNTDLLRQVASVAAPAFIGALIIFLALAQRPETFRKWVHRITAHLPAALGGKLAGVGNDIIDGLSALRRPRDLFGLVVASYVAWMVEVSVYWCVAQAVGLSASYPLLLMMVGVMHLAGAVIPAAPGGVGVYEFLASSVLIAAGIANEQAAAYALLAHVVIWLPPTLMGLIMLPRMGLTLSNASHGGRPS